MNAENNIVNVDDDGPFIYHIFQVLSVVAFFLHPADYFKNYLFLNGS